MKTKIYSSKSNTLRLFLCSKKHIKIITSLLVAFVIYSGSVSGQIAQRGTATSGTTTSTSLIINKPVGIVAGDIMIVNITQTGNTGTNASSIGWTLIAGARQSSGTRRSTVLYRISDGTEGSSFTFTLGGGTNAAVGSIIAFSGVWDYSPFDVTPGSFSVDGGSTITATGITTNTPGAAVIFLAGATANSANTYSNWTGTTPGLTEIMDFSNSSSVSVGAAWGIRATAGTTGNRSVTVTGNYYWAGILIALQPAPAPGSTVSQTFNYTGSNQTFTVPDGVTEITVEAWGGGGSGGNISSTTGARGGGGGGGYSRSTLTVSPQTNYTISIGVGSSSTSAGGSSWFSLNTAGNALVLANGGNSAANSGTSGATGAAVGIGTIRYTGGNGGNGNTSGNSGGGGGGAGSTGAGGNANGGTAGTGTAVNGGNGGDGRGTNGNGAGGSTYGGGGAGARRTSWGSSTGGNGANGQVIVSWTVPYPCQNGTLTLTSATGTDNQTVCNNSAITPITYNVGGSAETASATGLPNGVTGSYAGGVFTISGTPTQAGTFNYTVTTTGTPAGCTEGTATGTITVNPLPTATLSGNLNICEGSAAALSVNFTGTSPWSIVLQTGSGAQVTIDDITQSSYSLSVYPTASTTYTIVSVTDANCTNTGSGSASVTVSPTAQIGSVSPASSAVCLGSGTGTLTLTGYSGYTILNWQRRLGTGDWEDIAHASDTYSETPAEAGTWEYRVLTEATGGGCPNISASAVVTVNPSPTALLSGNNLICDGEETTLSIYVTATGNWTLQLSDGSTVTGTGTGFASKMVSPTVNTTYTLTSLSDATCSALPGGLTGSAAITINPTCPYTIIRRPQQLTALIDGGGNLCPGDPNPVPINVGITGGNQPYTVTWPTGNPDPPNGSQSGITGAQATPFTFGVTPSSTITYSGANVMVFDSKGCVSAKTGSALVNVSDIILFAVDYSDISCFGGNDGWIMIEVDGTGTYYFSIDNGETYIEGEENSPVFTFENLSIGTYKIRIKDQFGCESPDCDEEP